MSNAPRDKISFEKPNIVDEVCFLGEDGLHRTAVVIEVYDDGSCVLAVPGQDGQIEHKCNTPYCTGPAIKTWHWPRQSMGCPIIKRGY